MTRTYSVSGSIANSLQSAHRRTNSKAAVQDHSAYKSSDVQVRAKQPFAFPSTPVLNGSPPSSDKKGLQPVYEDEDFVHQAAGPSLSKHRLSPSLPYPPFMPSPNESTRPSTSSAATPFSPLSRIFAHLKKSQPIDLGFGAIFAISLLIFTLALGGVGYVPPPNKTSMPLVIPSNPHYAVPAPVQPPIYAQQEAPPRPVLPDNPVQEEVIQVRRVAPLHSQNRDGAAPLVITDDTEDDEIPAWKPDVPSEQILSKPNPEDYHKIGMRPVAQADDGRRRRQPVPVVAAEQRDDSGDEVYIERQQNALRVNEEEGQAMIANSPNDPLLDEEHADHSHHEDSVYDRAPIIGDDGHDHAHHHEPMGEPHVPDDDDDDDEDLRDLQPEEMGDE